MFEILIAFGLDLLLGDPGYSWHPVRIMGRWIERTERWLRFLIPSARLAGFLQALLLPFTIFFGVWFLCEVTIQIQPFLGKIFSIYFIYSVIAVRDLEVEAKRVYAALLNRKLETARKNLSRLVGRDTANLSEEEVARGAVEAVAESFVDGILAPLFYAALGGAPLAMAYKAINTLDSMVANRSPRYREFGFTAAKLDEIVNWIPARISWFLIGIGAAFINGRMSEAWRVGVEDGARTSFSNSVVPEAAFAGALGVELGGANFYQGEKVETPKLGYPLRPLEVSDIRLAYRLMKASAWASLVFAMILSYLAQFIFTKMSHPL